MHYEVLSFIKNLDEITDNRRSQLSLLMLRISTVKENLEWAPKEQKLEHKEKLQQFMDLFAHIYHRQPLRKFGNLTVIDNIH